MMKGWVQRGEKPRPLEKRDHWPYGRQLCPHSKFLKFSQWGRNTEPEVLALKLPLGRLPMSTTDFVIKPMCPYTAYTMIHMREIRCKHC